MSIRTEAIRLFTQGHTTAYISTMLGIPFSQASWYVEQRNQPDTRLERQRRDEAFARSLGVNLSFDELGGWRGWSNL